MYIIYTLFFKINQCLFFASEARITLTLAGSLVKKPVFFAIVGDLSATLTAVGCFNSSRMLIIWGWGARFGGFSLEVLCNAGKFVAAPLCPEYGVKAAVIRQPIQGGVMAASGMRRVVNVVFFV